MLRCVKLKRKKDDNMETQEALEAAPVATRVTFEAAFESAGRAVDHLEQGDLSLAASLDEYESGLKAIKQCYEILAQAQKRIEVLSDKAGVATWETAASHPGLKEALEHVEREEDLPRAP